ncbi:MAG: Gfo/Idh/MocA family protein, partial [Halobacteriaceae archaeon]
MYDVAVIGAGNPEETEMGTSTARAYEHARGYERVEGTDIVACADIVPENAERFAGEFDCAAYEDYREMLRGAEPDVVSVCTPVPTHADIVVGAAETGVPRAIHCEKPMADTWADCERMARVCDERDIQLTFNHQRRFDPARLEAKRLLNEGAIGELRRLETAGKNLLDWGTHLIDLCNYFNDEARAEWVLAGLDYTEADVRYGTHNENQSVALWEYEDGLPCLAVNHHRWESDVVGAQNRLVGTEGEITVATSDDTPLRVRRGDSVEEPDVEEADLY